MEWLVQTNRTTELDEEFPGWEMGELNSREPVEVQADTVKHKDPAVPSASEREKDAQLCRNDERVRMADGRSARGFKR